MKNVLKKGKTIFLAVLMLSLALGTIPVAEVQAKALSKKEKAYYSKVLKEKKYIEDTEHSIYEGGEFLLYDMNGDGRKELIVGGMLGLRCASFSIIYSYDGKKFHKTETINGEVSAVSPKGIAFTYDDYSQAGIVRYHEVSTYKLSSKGVLTQKLNEYLETKTDTETWKERTVKHNFCKLESNKEKKISKKAYTKAYKAYKFKTVGNNFSYEENGKTITRKFDIQLHSVDESNIKKYIR